MCIIYVHLFVYSTYVYTSTKRKLLHRWSWCIFVCCFLLQRWTNALCSWFLNAVILLGVDDFMIPQQCDPSSIAVHVTPTLSSMSQYPSRVIRQDRHTRARSSVQLNLILCLRHIFVRLLTLPVHVEQSTSSSACRWTNFQRRCTVTDMKWIDSGATWKTDMIKNSPFPSRDCLLTAISHHSQQSTFSSMCLSCCRMDFKSVVTARQKHGWGVGRWQSMAVIVCNPIPLETIWLTVIRQDSELNDSMVTFHHWLSTVLVAEGYLIMEYHFWLLYMSVSMHTAHCIT